MPVKADSPFKEVVGPGALKKELAFSRRGTRASLIFGRACLAGTPAVAMLAALPGYNAFNNFGLRRLTTP